MDGTGEARVSREIDKWVPSDFLKKRIQSSSYNRRAFDRIWYRNALFYLGQQWLRYQRQTQQWRPIAVPDWFPKQVTNKYAVAVDYMKSVFEQSDPTTLFTPASNEPEDVAASRAAEDIDRLIDQEVDQSLLETRLATWICLTGNGFVIGGYDKDDKKNGSKFLPDYSCLACGQLFPAESWNGGCPACGNQAVMPAKNPDGSPMGKMAPIGRMFRDIASPFELHFDMQAGDVDQSPYVYRARTYPVDTLKEMFPDKKDKIKGDDAGIDSGMFYQSALAYITNASYSAPGNYGGSVGSVDNVPRATLYHVWVRPGPEHPNGAEALVVGSTTLWKGELSYHDEQGNPFIPITHFQFNNVPGRIFAKTPADDMVSKQVQLNKMEALVQMAMERTSNPTWLLPKGIGIDAISGEPGEKIWYNGFLNGMKPERLGGAELPGAVFRWMEAIQKDLQDISHTYDVMKGQTPKGFPTLGGAQLLLERGFAGFNEALKSWGRGWTQVKRHSLNIWREYASDERTMAVLGPNQEWEAKKFSSASLQGRINVYLDEGSVQPKSKAYQQLVTSQLIESQLIDLSDPSVRVKVFQTFDAVDLVESLDLDLKDAVKEREEFLKTGQLRPRPGIDNDAVHNAQHLKDIKGDSFKSWHPEAQQLFIQHVLYHQQQLQQAAEAAAQNDPKVIAAKMREKEMGLELQALGQQKEMELQSLDQRKKLELGHQQAKKTLELHAHGLKTGMDSSLAMETTKSKAATTIALTNAKTAAAIALTREKTEAAIKQARETAKAKPKPKSNE